MRDKTKHKNKRKHRKKRARSPSSSSSSSGSSARGSRTPPPTKTRKRSKVPRTNEAQTVSTNSVTLHNIIPDFDPLKDNVWSWLNVIDSYASTFSWNDHMIRYQALNKLKGSAKIWYESLLRNNHAWTTWLWKDWKEKIANTFTISRNMFELLKDIIDRKPIDNQSLYDFFFEQKSRIDSLC